MGAQNVPEGGGNPGVSSAEIDAGSCMDPRVETHAKTRAISIQKVVAHDAENASPNAKQALICRADRRIHGTRHHVGSVPMLTNERAPAPRLSRRLRI
jgi:hypothetical protein